MGVHLDTPCANKWKGISNSQIFFPFRGVTCRFSVGISEGLFHNSWKLNDRPKDTNRHDFAERQTSAWAEKNDSLGLHSARRQAGMPVGILGCNGSGYRQRRIPQPVSDFT